MQHVSLLQYIDSMKMCSQLCSCCMMEAIKQSTVSFGLRPVLKRNGSVMSAELIEKT